MTRQQSHLRDAQVCCFSWPSAPSCQFTGDPTSITTVFVSVFYVAIIKPEEFLHYLFAEEEKNIFRNTFSSRREWGWGRKKKEKKKKITFHPALIQTFSVQEHLKLKAGSEPLQVFSRAFSNIYHTNECPASAYCHFLYITVIQAPKTFTI